MEFLVVGDGGKVATKFSVSFIQRSKFHDFLLNFKNLLVTLPYLPFTFPYAWASQLYAA